MKTSDLLEIGKITSIHGIKGEVKVYPLCDTPDFLTEFQSLFWKSGTPVYIENARVQKNMVIMKIEGVDTPEDAQKLRNHVLYMDRNDVELEEGTYFIADLIGLTVKDFATGVTYGELVDVTETGANDVYHVKSPEGKLLLVPAIPQVIDKVDLENGEMLITPLDGLFDI